jgi:nucleotide-binding universal stress UspA family protein
MLTHILVPLDESELAEKALPYARDIVAPDGKLTFVYVLDDGGLSRYSDERREQILMEMHESTEAYFDRLAAPLRQDGIRVKWQVREGAPADVIVDLAKELHVNAITMSTHGRTGFSRWRFGSVAQKVLGAAPCPVFIVPALKMASSE